MGLTITNWTPSRSDLGFSLATRDSLSRLQSRTLDLKFQLDLRFQLTNQLRWLNRNQTWVWYLESKSNLVWSFDRNLKIHHDLNDSEEIRNAISKFESDDQREIRNWSKRLGLDRKSTWKYWVRSGTHMRSRFWWFRVKPIEVMTWIWLQSNQIASWMGITNWELKIFNRAPRNHEDNSRN